MRPHACRPEREGDRPRPDRRAGPTEEITVEIQIPSLLRIKPRALYKLGKYLRKHRLQRVALFYGEGIKDLLGQAVEISLDSSEILVATEEVVRHNAIEDVVTSAFQIPLRRERSWRWGAGWPLTSPSTPGSSPNCRSSPCPPRSPTTASPLRARACTSTGSAPAAGRPSRSVSSSTRP